jgi:hypothetical protein
VERDIVVGMSNDRVVEVREGLNEGDQVVLNPKKLAGDKAKVREAKEGSDGPAPERRKKDKEGREPSPDKPSGSPGAPRPDGPVAGAPPGGASPSPEDRQKQMTERFQKAAPEERKGMLEKIPEEFREKARERLKAAGIDIPS